jgi:2-hydroxychromene-2-carboxylate isomerase
MKHITFYLDFLSPYAYLAFETLPEALLGHSYSVSYKPVLLAALLNHHGQLGPAEIPAKRDWTFRQILWLAQQRGVPLQLPAAHPFNPLPLLRLAVASQAQGLPNRHVVEAVFHHVWRGGGDAMDATRLPALAATLARPHAPLRDPASAEVKAQLKAHTDEAIALGVFGVPTLAVDDKLFWGLDALPMLGDYLAGNAWFDGPAWEQARQLPAGVQRTR